MSRLKRSCESEHSALSKNLSPLLKEPLSLEHLTSFSERLKITYADNYKIQDQYLEFLKVQWSEPQSLARLMSIGSMLEDFKSISSHDGRGPMPVLKYSTTLHDSGMTSIYCIEWRSFEYRDDVLVNPGWRRSLKDSTEEERKVILQKWNKTDETITPEEELSLFFLSIGARGSDSQLVRAKLVNAAYFGWSTSQATQRPKPCNIL